MTDMQEKIDPQSADQQPDEQRPDEQQQMQSEQPETAEQPAEGKKEKKAAKKKKSREEQLQEEYDQLNDRYLRVLAEYDNFRKRSQKEKDALYLNAQGDTITQFLDIYDNFVRALEFPCADEQFRKGLDMIFTAFQTSFEKLGVESFGEAGDAFDANRHNAVMHEENETLGENVVSQVFQKGYRLKDRVLRYAVVKVAN